MTTDLLAILTLQLLCPSKGHIIVIPFAQVPSMCSGGNSRLIIARPGVHRAACEEICCPPIGLCEPTNASADATTTNKYLHDQTSRLHSSHLCLESAAFFHRPVHRPTVSGHKVALWPAGNSSMQCGHRGAAVTSPYLASYVQFQDHISFTSPAVSHNRTTHFGFKGLNVEGWVDSISFRCKTRFPSRGQQASEDCSDRLKKRISSFVADA
ncbi:hypothetical protein SODALDRAFT_357609 [Sodiomyces alkalinus F11]|uniref:Secreted protein n=1 Tax=Sodiomyces alkalinus (strain CBS 110278 / VKM F-3762 / F11) TaxID=1314773 RepID=A0A3N2Q4L9_SODAK|nr:hypothetical protein SODALDRAFT_357609 [Sodiomyces alkalinus F11]ROT41555.1 hypothetical protein SODALDRAFT_357609 [Sodiomyces alkalinus F11]